jgi:hypothetical protein
MWDAFIWLKSDSSADFEFTRPNTFRFYIRGGGIYLLDEKDITR